MHSTDAAYCNRYRTQRGLSVCVLFIRKYCAKIIQPIEMRFERLTRVDPRNRVLDGVENSRSNEYIREV